MSLASAVFHEFSISCLSLSK